MKRVEKDIKKLQRMYDLGTSDCMKKLDEIKEYITSK
jgi:predicted patatin/cPLA2 family phospholipase